MNPIYALFGLMFLTWGAAIYASYAGSPPQRQFPPAI
jgi:hypothetical protein